MPRLMNKLYEAAMQDFNEVIGMASEKTDHGEITCMVSPKQSRTNPAKPRSYSKSWRLNGDVISAAKLKNLLSS